MYCLYIYFIACVHSCLQVILRPVHPKAAEKMAKTCAADMAPEYFKYSKLITVLNVAGGLLCAYGIYKEICFIGQKWSQKSPEAEQLEKVVGELRRAMQKKILAKLSVVPSDRQTQIHFRTDC